MGGCMSARYQENIKQIHLEGLMTIIAHATAAKKLFQNSPVLQTPLLQLPNSNIYLKLENFQVTGSFKFRGAYLTMHNHQGRVAIASTGNFAKACNYALNPNPKPAIVNFTKTDEGDAQVETRLITFVSTNVCPEKIQGMQVTYYGQDCVEAENKAIEYAKQEGIHYASPYNSIDMIAANSTIASEIYHQLEGKPIDYIFVSVGGGGLIAGIAIELKCILKLPCKIIGVQPQTNAAMFHKLKNNAYELKDTISDATAGDVEEKSMTIEICRLLVDDWILVPEDSIKQAQRTLFKEHKLIVEGSAALAYAGLLEYPVPQKNRVAVMCGSNLDVATLINN